MFAVVCELYLLQMKERMAPRHPQAALGFYIKIVQCQGYHDDWY
jgi:hypothetical protein